MSSLASKPENANLSAPDQIMIWHWPLLQTGWKGVFYMVVLILVYLTIRILTNQNGMATLAVLAILAVTVWFWFPIKYQFGKNGIERRILGIPQRIPWARIERYKPMQDGVRLYRTIPSSNALSSVFVSWSGRRQLIEQTIQHYTRRVRTRHRGSSSFSTR